MAYAIKQWEEVAPNYCGGTLVLGNGASIAVSPRFNYKNLLEHAQQANLLPGDVHRLFQLFGTNDFELILRRVWQANNINIALGIPDEGTHRAYLNVRSCLIKAVCSVHPERDEIKDCLPNIYEFIKRFDTVVSLNYDLLVYWAATYGLSFRDGHSFKDCFINDGAFSNHWKSLRTPYSPYSEESVTLVFYPHGNLILCRNAFDRELKIRSAGEGLLNAILGEWCNEEVVPLFVSEGTVEQKTFAIQKSNYLSTVYREALVEPKTKLTIFGWSMGTHDLHLLRQMHGTGIQQVAISVFEENQGYCHHATQVIQECLGSHIRVDFFDSDSPECWIHASPSSF